MGKIVDHMAVILPFEKELYADANVSVTFTGHPLTNEVVADKTKQQAREQLGIGQLTTIGLFPGSRSSEIKRIFPVLLESAKQIIKEKPGVQFILPVANTSIEELLAAFQAEINELSIVVTIDKFYDVVQSCDVILTASGTATLEIGLLEVPMVIVYKVSPLTFYIMRSLAITRFIGLVNIVAEKGIVKEFIQHEATAENIAGEIDHLLSDDQYRNNMISELNQVRARLGKEGGSNNVAQLAYEMLE